MSRTISNVTVGAPDVSPSRASHVKGIHSGNAPGNLRRQDGMDDHGTSATARARRSTSINPDRRDPIDPRMPKLPPP